MTAKLPSDHAKQGQASTISNADAVASSSSMHELPLPTPNNFAFPYPQPYAIQVDLMKTVFRAIEDRKIAIVESPTGTGKSLTLLTATLTWLAAHRDRLDTAAENELRARFIAEDPDDPPWIIERAVKRHMSDLRSAADARARRLSAVRERERRARLAGSAGAFRSKRARILPASGGGSGSGKAIDSGPGDDEFLPDDIQEEGVQAESDDVHLSAEVRALMATYAKTLPQGATEDDDIDDDVPKVYYASRTHSQLRQLTAELLKTSFPAGKRCGGGDNDDESAIQANGSVTDGIDGQVGVSLVPLASRRQLCINDRVRSLARGGEEKLNEACLDMQKSGAARCEYLPPKSDEGPMLDARDTILATVRDIEDLVVEGRKSGVCPYYATRKAVRQAQLVTLPYNLLLQQNAREALGIDLTNQIVVIDEAHNLIDAILGIYSTALPATHLVSAAAQLTQYLARFRTRLKSRHAIWIAQTLAVLRGLVRMCETFAAPSSMSTSTGQNAQPTSASMTNAKRKSEMINVNDLLSRIGGGGDQVNLVELVAYLKESKLARKVSGFTESLETANTGKMGIGESAKRSSAVRHASIAAFHTVEAFLLSLTDARDDGRVILTLDDAAANNATSSVLIKYVLLNPAERFADIVERARCVILAGGTMEPVSDFFRQLFPTIPRDRFSTLSCAHVIPKTNLLTQVVQRGPRKIDLEFNYANRGDGALIGELGAVVQSTVGLVPDGVVVFLPSYAFLDKLKSSWTSLGLLEKLNQKKQVFYEPQTAADVDIVLRDYALAISTPQTTGSGRTRTGALLFAVVGGKLSEGINFSDRLGRCVIMVGLPFANVGSVELQERMRYVERLPGAAKDAAKDLYENLCMRAVNQSIGRAIRHANDYATILLVDKRYCTPRIRSKLPRWIGEDVVVQEDWAGTARAMAAFFRDKRGK